VLDDAFGPAEADDFLPRSIDARQRSLLRRIVSHPQMSPLTTSAGRLFDVAAVLCLGAERADFDGQLAMRLESVVDPTAEGQYRFTLQPGEVAQLDWRPTLRDLCQDLRRGASPGTVAMRFHRTMAAAIFEVCRQRTDLPVVLSGGVFQNRILTELLYDLWADGSRPICGPGVIPPGDGGLAAGQLAAAMAWEDDR
jgi:hydrogenase maturation protein HypF